MARLAAIEKMLYYPTPERVVRMIASKIKIDGFTDNYRAFAIDTCCGEGDALSTLVDMNGCPHLVPFGIELDAKRKVAAAKKLARVYGGSYHQLTEIGGGSKFDLLFLNPPYDHDVDDDGNSTRAEYNFVEHGIKVLGGDGIGILVLPHKIFDGTKIWKMIRDLGVTFHYMRLFKFPEPEYQDFNQCVLIFQLEGSYEAFQWNENRVAKTREIVLSKMEVLDFSPEPIFRLLPSQYRYGERKMPTLTWESTNPVDWLPPREKKESVYGTEQWSLLVGGDGNSTGKPLIAPRPGHQAMLIAAGALNGAEIAHGLIIKGSSEKVEIEKKEGKDIVIREKIVSRLSTFDTDTGAFETWLVSEDEKKTVAWFKEYGEEISAAVLDAYSPLFDGDTSEFEEDFEFLTAPGILPGKTAPEILDIQKQAAVACVMNWRRGEKTTIISGEMGTGKTTIGISSMALYRSKKTIVICPGHLVRKWIRECELIMGRKGIAVTADSISDVDNFFKVRPRAPRFLVISKERAKLGSKWMPAYWLKKHRNIVKEAPRDEWGNATWGAARKVVRVWEEILCPKCGMKPTGANGDILSEHKEFKNQETCRNKIDGVPCREPLWQALPISDIGTKRWPLARYIRDRYSNRYSLIIDECHAYAKSSSAQAKASQDLITGAKVVLAMTGTVYAGKASSLFHLLFKLSYGFRAMYAYDEVSKFVAHHGLFEEKINEEESTSVYGTRKGGRKRGRIKEMPGVSPAMIPIILPYTIFIKLKDLRMELPPYTESVELIDCEPKVLNSVLKLQSSIKLILREHPEVLSQYLMACLGYPDRPDQRETIMGDDKQNGGRVLVASAEPIEGLGLLPKDKRLIEICEEEKADGRQVLVFFSQTHRRDARMRVKEGLEAAGLTVSVLEHTVSPDKREEWLKREEKKGFDVMLTNGRLVETGLDLLFAATIIQYGIEYNINTLRQSIRRSWRLGQRKDIRVIFMAYRGTMQEGATSLIARKMRAAEMLDGDDIHGLSQHDEGGNNILYELAQEAVRSTSSFSAKWKARTE